MKIQDPSITMLYKITYIKAVSFMGKGLSERPAVSIVRQTTHSEQPHFLTVTLYELHGFADIGLRLRSDFPFDRQIAIIANFL